METTKLGHSGLSVSRVALGSWLTFGSSVDAETTGRCVEAALDAGINFIDTADVYARGEAESVLGAVLSGTRRKDLVIATKLYWPMSDNPNDKGLSRKHIVDSVHGSLQRLRSDYIDLYQCHRYDEETPLEETVRAMGDMITQGKILYWGVSCWTADQILDACRIADGLGAPRPISNQPPYNLLERSIEAEVIPTSDREGLSQVVFSPLAQGILTGKYTDGVPPGSRGADEARNVWMRDHLHESVQKRVQSLVALAGDLGTTAARLALAWCIRSRSVASVIVGATRPEQVEDNVGAAELQLDEASCERLDELFPGI